MNVAQLKLGAIQFGERLRLLFPRSNERGSIEAHPRPGERAHRRAFPRSNERGSIEASGRVG